MKEHAAGPRVGSMAAFSKAQVCEQKGKMSGDRSGQS